MGFQDHALSKAAHQKEPRGGPTGTCQRAWAGLMSLGSPDREAGWARAPWGPLPILPLLSPSTRGASRGGPAPPPPLPHTDEVRIGIRRWICRVPFEAVWPSRSTSLGTAVWGCLGALWGPSSPPSPTCLLDSSMPVLGCDRGRTPSQRRLGMHRKQARPWGTLPTTCVFKVPKTSAPGSSALQTEGERPAFLAWGTPFPGTPRTWAAPAIPTGQPLSVFSACLPLSCAHPGCAGGRPALFQGPECRLPSCALPATARASVSTAHGSPERSLRWHFSARSCWASGKAWGQGQGP